MSRDYRNQQPGQLSCQGLQQEAAVFPRHPLKPPNTMEQGDTCSGSQWIRKLMLAAVWVGRDSSAPAGNRRNSCGNGEASKGGVLRNEEIRI